MSEATGQIPDTIPAEDTAEQGQVVAAAEPEGGVSPSAAGEPENPASMGAFEALEAALAEIESLEKESAPPAPAPEPDWLKAQQAQEQRLNQQLQQMQQLQAQNAKLMQMLTGKLSPQQPESPYDPTWEEIRAKAGVSPLEKQLQETQAKLSQIEKANQALLEHHQQQQQQAKAQQIEQQYFAVAKPAVRQTLLKDVTEGVEQLAAEWDELLVPLCYAKDISPAQAALLARKLVLQTAQAINKGRMSRGSAPASSEQQAAVIPMTKRSGSLSSAPGKKAAKDMVVPPRSELKKMGYSNELDWFLAQQRK